MSDSEQNQGHKQPYCVLAVDLSRVPTGISTTVLKSNNNADTNVQLTVCTYLKGSFHITACSMLQPLEYEQESDATKISFSVSSSLMMCFVLFLTCYIKIITSHGNETWGWDAMWQNNEFVRVEEGQMYQENQDGTWASRGQLAKNNNNLKKSTASSGRVKWQTTSITPQGQ